MDSSDRSTLKSSTSLSLVQGNRGISNTISIPVLTANKLEVLDGIVFFEDHIHTL